MEKRKKKQVHFQITRNCNLRCPFCGQWGKKGFFGGSSGNAMTLADWERVISELVSYRERNGRNITVTVWGGEPLVSPYFDVIIRQLKEKEFNTEVITNGVLIDCHSTVLNECTDRLYVSLDGTKEVHDAIRGEGVFEKVTVNLANLKHKNVTVMSVITPKLLETLPEFVSGLEKLDVNRLYLQDMIGLTAGEINEYKRWLKDTIDIAAKDINSWENDKLFKAEQITLSKPGFEITHKSHFADGYCKSPFYHAHIAWNGNVLYCTDFYDFSAGNVKNNTLEDIFLNEKSEKFREETKNGRCVTCRHCSWKSNDFI